MKRSRIERGSATAASQSPDPAQIQTPCKLSAKLEEIMPLCDQPICLRRRSGPAVPCTGSIQIQAGTQTITAADSLPDNLRQVLNQIHATTSAH
jgi:hypothetical protein